MKPDLSLPKKKPIFLIMTNYYIKSKEDYKKTNTNFFYL